MPDLVRVLMVEDVADDAALVERELGRAGIMGATRRVDSERAYREALRTFAPDIILTDHFFFQAEDGIRVGHVTGVQTCALPIYELAARSQPARRRDRRRAGSG